MTTTEKVQPRLKSRYRAEIRDALHQQFNYANVMQIPTVVKVVVNMGVGDAARDAKLINGAVNDLALITGQRPEIRKARKSIAQFKLREGMPIG
ncbi:50S ribosomal protein L5, partial [Mycobacterium sp.]